MTISADFEHVSNLRLKVRALEARVKELEEGGGVAAARADAKSQLAQKDREIKALKHKVDDAERRIKDMRKNWMQTFEDVAAEHAGELRRRDASERALEERALRAERRLDATLAASTAKDKEIRRLSEALEEERLVNKKLKAQIARDWENSSIPSSQKPNHKKIANGREPTGRKPGGQPGHEGHGRKRQLPTDTVFIPPPAKYTDSSSYRPTGRMVTKQLVGIRTTLLVTDYTTPEFRDVRTRQRVHADFPEGVVNDINYDGSIKALAFLLSARYCMATDKVRELLGELTGGALELSCGMINGLCKELSAKTEKERRGVFADMLLVPVMGTDFTCARVNARQLNVAVCASGNSALYFAREHKGHEGVKGTPVKDYQGTLVHDHDKTYYSYGSSHQECLSHVIRYLKSSRENEPNLTWSTVMLSLVREMIHYRNSLKDQEAPDASIVKSYEARYKEALFLAKEEYGRDPPNKYYRDGYNLYLRMGEHTKDHLLFLHDKAIPSDNNLCERLLRVFKRKQRQAMSFRSFESLGYLCDGMSVIASLRSSGLSLLPSISETFNQTYPPSREVQSDAVTVAG